jgi:hypothetical protein
MSTENGRGHLGQKYLSLVTMWAQSNGMLLADSPTFRREIHIRAVILFEI